MQEFRKYGTSGDETDYGVSAVNKHDGCYIDYTHIPDDSDLYIPWLFEDDREPRQEI